MSAGQFVENSEARAIDRRQRRTATLVSFITAILLMVLIALILAVILFVSTPKEEARTIIYSSTAEQEQKLKTKKVRTDIVRRPASPSATMSRMMAVNTPTPIQIHVPEIQVEEIAMEVGAGDDFSGGWGDGEGFETGMGATFFGKRVEAERIAYVIDFSSSMNRENRHELMREELVESFQTMQPGLELSMVFFAGTAWVAGDAFEEGVVTTQQGDQYHWIRSEENRHAWEPSGEKQPVPWWTVTDEMVAELTEVVQSAPLSSGTAWDHPLNMVLDMEPAPQMIYFMTDGAASGAMEWAKQVGKRAKKMGVTINCVALMEPEAVEGLKLMSKLSGGETTMVTRDGTRKRLK